MTTRCGTGFFTRSTLTFSCGGESWRGSRRVCSGAASTWKDDSIRTPAVPRRNLSRYVTHSIRYHRSIQLRTVALVVYIHVDPGQSTIIGVTLGSIGQHRILVNKRLHITGVVSVLIHELGSNPSDHFWGRSISNLPLLAYGKGNRVGRLGNDCYSTRSIPTRFSTNSFQATILAILATSWHSTRSSTRT